MLTTTTCPHLVLGLPSHAESSAATPAFARKSKVVRAGQNTIFSIEDLTTALSEIETKTTGTELRYSIPANPLASLWPESIELEFANHRIDTDVGHLVGNTPSDTSLKESLADFFLSASLNRVLSWDWDDAAICARECLRLSSVETRRDEALNLLAVSWLMVGESEKAINALKKSVEGEWNLALRTNLAIVATAEDPDLAVEQMKFLIEGAPNPESQVAACRRAISLWRSTQEEWTGSSDEDDFEPLPQSVLDSIHIVLGRHGLSEEIFYELGMFLAGTDGDRLTGSGAISASPHLGSPSAALVMARARSIGDFVKELPLAERRSSGSRPWITAELDSMVGSINSNLVGDTANDFVVGMAFSYVESGLDCSTFQRTLLRGLLVLGIIPMFEGNNDAPNEYFIDWISEAQRASTRLTLTNDQSTLLTDVLGRAGNVLSLLFHRALLTEGSKVEDVANNVRQRTTGILNRLTVNNNDVREAAHFVDNWCSTASSKCERLEAIAVDHQICSDLRQFRVAIDNVRQKVARYV